MVSFFLLLVELYKKAAVYYNHSYKLIEIGKAMDRLKNPFFALVLASFLVSFFLSVNLGYKLYQYFDLSKETRAQILSWEIRKKSKNLYQVGVHYRYQTPKGVFESFSLVASSYPNKQAAINSLTNLKKESYTAFYTPGSPENSCLDRIFPYNFFFRWLLSLVLLIYFFSLFLKKSKKQLEV